MRLRLTLWAVAIFTVIQVTLAFVLLLYYQQSIKTARDDTLKLAADKIRQEVIETAPDWSAASLSAQLNNVDYDLVGAIEVAIVSMKDGQPLISSANRRAVGAVASEIPRGKPAFADLEISPVGENGNAVESYRGWVEPIRGADNGDYALLVYTKAASIRPALRIVAGVILLFGPIGVLAAGIAGWFLAGVAVHPIIQLQTIARRISPQSIDDPITLDSSTTEVAKLREELDQALHRLEDGYIAQSRFIANVSHELRTPISVLLSEAETLRLKEPLSGRSEEFVESVIEEMKRLGKTIDSFLLLSRIREKGVERVEQLYLFNELVMDSFEACIGFAEHCGVSLRPVLIDDEDELMVCGDPDLLRTMIDNVVRNAIRFSPTGDVVEITAARDNGHVLVRVRDHGPGMPPKLMPRIFDRYVQADGEKRQNRGIGLGLAIAQGIAHLHGGEIVVAAPSDGGCEVTMSLPVVVHERSARRRADMNKVS